MVTMEKPRLVVFDVEGVLIPKNRFFFEVGKSLGFIKMIKILFYGFLYEAGLLRLKSVLTNVFSQIKMRNCKIALISSGLPTVIVKRLADEVGADYAYGIEAETKDGVLT